MASVSYLKDAIAVTVAHSWRTGPDIYIPWDLPRWTTVLNNADLNTRFAALARPGYYNDPDFLLVGLCDGWAVNVNNDYGLTDVEDRSHFNLWCMMASTLILGSDVIRLNQTSIDILTNREMVALDQDSLGYQGRPVRTNPDQTQIWSKNLKNGDVAVMLLNRSSTPKSITVRWADIGKSGSFRVRDLWPHEDLGDIRDSLRVDNIRTHGSEVYRVSGEAVNITSHSARQPARNSSQAWRIIGPSDRLGAGVQGQRVFDVQGRETRDPGRARFVMLKSPARESR